MVRDSRNYNFISTDKSLLARSCRTDKAKEIKSEHSVDY